MTEEEQVREEEQITEETADSTITMRGTVIFKLMNGGSKSEGQFPFLEVEETEVVVPEPVEGPTKFIPLYLENSNPFENSTLKQFEGKEITAEGTMKDGVFHITKIAPCLTETEGI